MTRSHITSKETMGQDLELMKRELVALMKERSIIRGEITLSSGIKSDFYIDGKQVTLLPHGAFLVANIIFELIRNTDIQAVGGLSMGADPIVSALSYLIGEKCSPVKTFLIRKEPKKHGTRKEIEGPFWDNTKVAIVDDVITTGASIIQSVEVVKKYGCEVKKIFVLLDRDQGTAEALKDYDVQSLVSMKDLGL